MANNSKNPKFRIFKLKIPNDCWLWPTHDKLSYKIIPLRPTMLIMFYILSALCFVLLSNLCQKMLFCPFQRSPQILCTLRSLVKFLKGAKMKKILNNYTYIWWTNLINQHQKFLKISWDRWIKIKNKPCENERKFGNFWEKTSAFIQQQIADHIKLLSPTQKFISLASIENL